MFKVRQGLRETEYMPINPGTEQHSLLLLNYKLTNIRPEVMCGIWYRESNFKLINNPFQFDPPLPVSQQEEILNAYGANHLTGAARDVALATGFLEHKCVIPNEIKGLAPNQPILADAYYNTTAGIPYFENILGQQPNVPYLKAQLIAAAGPSTSRQKPMMPGLAQMARNCGEESSFCGSMYSIGQWA